MSNLFVSIFTQGRIHNTTWARTINMVGNVASHKVRVTPYWEVPLENAQHMALVDFLNGGDDWWLLMDEDNPPPLNPAMMLDDLNRIKPAIYGLVTPVWRGDRVEPNAYRYVENTDTYESIGWQQAGGVVSVDAVGGGCMFVHRKVFDIDPVMRRAPFRRRLNSQGVVRRGNDLSFCRRARRYGFEIWADFDKICHHYVEIDLLALAPKPTTTQTVPPRTTEIDVE